MKRTILIAFLLGMLIAANVQLYNALAHECPVPFRDYMPDPIASQKYLGLDPDGLPYKEFGEEWVKRYLDETGYDLIVEFGGVDE